MSVPGDPIVRIMGGASHDGASHDGASHDGASHDGGSQDGTIFDRGYRRWGFAHAGILTALVLLAELDAVLPYAAALLAGWIGLAVAVLYRFARKTHPDGQGPRVPNVLTGIRTVSSCLLLAGLALSALLPEVAAAAHGSSAWWLVGVLLLVELTDFLDGRLARRAKAGRFGSIWDMENDAVFALALSLLLRHVHGVGVYVLLIGLMRYLYVLLWHREVRPAKTPPLQRLFSKTTTAVLVTTMIVVLAPVVGPQTRAVALMVILTMQVISFAWDMALQCRSPA